MMVCAAAEAEAICSTSGILASRLTLAATTTMQGARNAFSRSRRSASAETSGSRRREQFSHEVAEAATLLRADDDEMPRSQAPMIGRADGRGEDTLQLLGRRTGRFQFQRQLPGEQQV